MNIHLMAGILATVLISTLLTYRLAHLVANLVEVLLLVLGNLGVLNLIYGLSDKKQAVLWLKMQMPPGQ